MQSWSFQNLKKCDDEMLQDLVHNLNQKLNILLKYINKCTLQIRANRQDEFPRMVCYNYANLTN